MDIHYNRISSDPLIYEFAGDLEHFLLDIGVQQSHIEKMKMKKMKKTDFLDRCDCISDHSEVKIIPIDRIVGIRRALPDVSVFENVRKIDRKLSFSPDKMIGCLDYANKLSYSSLLQSYQMLPDPVGGVAHIIDVDEYYLLGEHNHTTICAMLFGAPFIKASIREYSINIQKNEKYERMMRFYQNMGIKKIERNFYDQIRIVFSEDDNCINYGMMKSNEGFDEILERLEESITANKKAIAIYNAIPFNILKRIYYNLFLTPIQKCHLEIQPYEASSDYMEFNIFSCK